MVTTPLKMSNPQAFNPISGNGSASSNLAGSTVSAEELRKINAYWLACNYKEN